jgi:hypothetical protein
MQLISGLFFLASPWTFKRAIKSTQQALVFEPH